MTSRGWVAAWGIAAIVGSAACAELMAQGGTAEAEAAYLRGEYSKAESGWREALLAKDRAGAPDPPGRAVLEFNLATALRAEARFDEAEQLYAKALSTREQLFGSESPLLAGPLRGLALVRLTMGKLDAAAALIARVRSIEARTPVARAEQGDTELVSATILFRQGAVAESQARATDALHLLEGGGARYTPSRIEVLSLLGLIARSKSNYRAAEEYYNSALAALADSGALSHPDRAVVWNNLGQVKLAEGRWREAESLFQRAIALWTNVYGPEHPDVASGLTNLAMVYGKRKRYATAEGLLRRAIAIHTRSGGAESSKVALDWNNVGYLKMRQGSFHVAEMAFRVSLRIYERTLGPEHPDTAQELENLAMACVAQKRYADATPLLARAVAIRERRPGPQDTELGELLETYARVLRIDESYARAAEVEARAMRIRVQALIHKSEQ